jgi:predicted RND superfamily exporter protein
MGIARLEVDSNFLDEFGDEEPIRIATAYADDVMGGTASFVYLFETGEPDGIKDPDVLREMARLQNVADEYGGMVRKTYSLGDILMELNKAFHEEDPAHYALPEARELVAQYLLVYEMSGGDEAQDYVSSDYSRSRLEIRSKLVASSELRDMADTLNAYLEAEPPKAAKVAATGMGELWLVMMEYITQSQIRGFLLAFTVIGLLLCILFRSVKTGLIAMAPNLSPAILTLGVMGWFDIPLDYVRLMIASVAIGISVDDTIHHVTRFHLEFKRCGSYERALHRSMNDVGRALFITSVVLVVGFLVNLGSRLDSIASFGALLATTIVVALVADFLLMPSLVLTLRPFGPERASADPAEVIAPAAS